MFFTKSWFIFLHERKNNNWTDNKWMDEWMNLWKMNVLKITFAFFKSIIERKTYIENYSASSAGNVWASCGDQEETGKEWIAISQFSLFQFNATGNPKLFAEEAIQCLLFQEPTQK